MGIAELLLVAIGLSMDAFAVAVGKGLSMKRLDIRQAAVIALFFGGFQALMPALGWLLGAQFEQFVAAVEGWIAFALLAFVGGKMIWDAARGESDADAAGSGPSNSAGRRDGGTEATPPLNLRELTMLAVATSIDAFAAGVAFALIDVDIAFTVAVIGATTFALSFAGVLVGHVFGSRWERPATLVGGCVLVAIGVKVLLGL